MKENNEGEIEGGNPASENKETLTGKMRENPWIVSTLVLGILSLILIVGNFSGGLTGNVVSGDNAGEKLVDFLNNNVIADGTQVTLLDTKEANGMYEVTLDYKGQEIPIYVTKDGSSYTTTLTPMQALESDTLAEVPKADKPKVELYVFTYCPYGLQMEKAFLPVVNLFKDKIDFKIRQIGAMHGEYEKIEAERQLCIEKNYPTKFLAYLDAFDASTAIGGCSQGEATCVKPLINAIYTKLGIDESKINSCMTGDGVTMYNAEVANSGKLGVYGSPTVIINGVETSLARSPDAIKESICASFKNAPAECSQTLSTSQASAGFGASTGSATATTASC